MSRYRQRSTTFNLTVLLTVLLLCRIPICAAADKIQIAPVENCTTAFAGKEFKVSMRIIAAEGEPGVPGGTLQWSHSANQRMIAQGEVQLNRGPSTKADLVLRSPELRDGVIFATTVTTDFVPQGKTEAAATLQRTLTLFPRNPLADRSEWAKSLDIELFDPTENTAPVFEDLKLPYRTVRNVSVVDDPRQAGIVIIGEGTSLVKYRALVETAMNAAASGRRIIMLAPSEGGFSLPGTIDDGKPNRAFPGELRFSGTQVITQLDKRLDAKSWIGTGNVIPSRLLKIESRRGRVEAHVSNTAPGWPWLEVRFPDTNGVFIICGFQIIKHWENGPTPRFLLVRILESLQGNLKQ